MPISCNSKHGKLEVKEIEDYNLTFDNQQISDSEFICFWKQFNLALIQNDTLKLSLFIDNNFNGYCSPKLDVSTICKINFKIDSTFTKDRFIKQFYGNLNPVYIELLKEFESKTNFVSDKTSDLIYGRNHLSKIVSFENYHLNFSLDPNSNNEFVTIVFCYGNILSNEGTKNIRLIFFKSNNQIKLYEIDCYYLIVD